MTNSPIGGADRKTFEANAQQVGAQRDAIGKKDLGRTASAQEAADLAAENRSNDQVELTERGQAAGEQTGIAGNLASQARRLSAARTAMEAGGIQPGDVAPGETPATPQAQPVAEPNTEAPAPGTDPTQPADPNQPTNPNQPTDPSQPTDPAAGSRSEYATKAKAAQDDAQNANMIMQQMAADRQKWLMQLWKIWQDTQTAIFQMMQEVMLNRQKVQDALNDKWDAVLGGFS